MLTLPSSVRIYVAAAPVDLSKGFYKLAAVARNVVHQDPLGGHIFVFFNRRKNRVKCLWWDRTGWILLYKKLERGTYALPTSPLPGQTHIEVDAGELAMMLEGIELGEAKRKVRWRRLPHDGRVQETTQGVSLGLIGFQVGATVTRPSRVRPMARRRARATERCPRWHGGQRRRRDAPHPQICRAHDAVSIARAVSARAGREASAQLAGGLGCLGWSSAAAIDSAIAGARDECLSRRHRRDRPAGPRFGA